MDFLTTLAYYGISFAIIGYVLYSKFKAIQKRRNERKTRK